MTNQSLARSYLVKAQKRLKALAVLRDEGAYSDVIREAQELVELALKGMLRAAGIEPPKFHDVGGLLLEHARKFSQAAREQLPRTRVSGCGVGGHPRQRGDRTEASRDLTALFLSPPAYREGQVASQRTLGNLGCTA
ncbi:MAG: HEPN domain-containing protein [Candidatus Rokubacteria bacterium]|nr:HEPN domain-containing protein [Candidatus Rokubacteria bacterium]